MRHLTKGIVVDDAGHYYFSPVLIAAAVAELFNEGQTPTGQAVSRLLIERALNAEAAGADSVGEIMERRGKAPFTRRAA
jgi:hypothetical protein